MGSTEIAALLGASMIVSLGLGNTAGAEILEGDVSKALKICHIHRAPIIVPPTQALLVGPL